MRTTTSRTEEPHLPPRGLVRVFWVLHRGLYLATGGRLGVRRPKDGGSFGMLRLHTIGRRSGKRRVAMVGYIEDGPNLVTIAMNGWSDAEPAWWLNLQARPEATVDLSGGSRAVRSRVAAGDERARLWSELKQFRGWGDDLDALSARRGREAAVVVLEPA